MVFLVRFVCLQLPSKRKVLLRKLALNKIFLYTQKELSRHKHVFNFLNGVHRPRPKKPKRQVTSIQYFDHRFKDTKLTFSQHINVTSTKVKQTLNTLKAFTSVKWGKHGLDGRCLAQMIGVFSQPRP